MALQLLLLFVLCMSVGSLIAVLKQLRDHSKMPMHWSVAASVSLLWLTTLTTAGGFTILIYQQSGYFFRSDNWLCLLSVLCALVTALTMPVCLVFVLRSQRNWHQLLQRFVKEVPAAKRGFWVECSTLNAAHTDMSYLVCVKQKAKTQSKSKLGKDSILFMAHKSRVGWHLISLMCVLVIVATIEWKYRTEERRKLMKWGYEFSRFVDEDDFAIAKWQREHGIRWGTGDPEDLSQHIWYQQWQQRPPHLFHYKPHTGLQP